MEKVVSMNQKRANKKPKNSNTKKKTRPQQPLKVVYITNPIKFKATASEFRSLVQELTGQDSDLPESAMIAAANGVGGGHGHVVKAEEADHGCAATSIDGGNGSDPSIGFGSIDDDGADVFYAQPQGSFTELMGSLHEDEFLKGFDAM